MSNFLALALGSLAGGFARYYLAGWIYRAAGTRFAYGTLAVNLLGCFLIGVLHETLHERIALSPHLRLLLMTGFCGAFTTFSTFILETGDLAKNGAPGLALLNILLSVGAGFVLYRLGIWAGERF